MAKIDQNLEFFSILLPSNSLWQQIFTIFTLLLCRGVVENDRRVWGPLGGPPGVLKVPKWPQEDSLKDQYRPFLDLWDPLVGPPPRPDTRLSLYTSPLDRISVKTANTCYQSEFDGRKIEKNSRFWSILAIFGPFGPPCWALRALHSLSFIRFYSLRIKSV